METVAQTSCRQRKIQGRKSNQKLGVLAESNPCRQAWQLEQFCGTAFFAVLERSSSFRVVFLTVAATKGHKRALLPGFWILVRICGIPPRRLPSQVTVFLLASSACRF